MNPDIKQLADESRYELVYSVPYKEMRSFVIRNISTHSLFIKIYSIFQIISLMIPFILLAFELVMIFTDQSSWLNFFMVIAGVLFSFTVLILTHELIHMLAFRLQGRRGLKIGGNLRQFIFYVEADKEVLNKKEYLFIAILPFVVILVLGILLSASFWNSSLSYFILTITCIHSLFCAGDFAIICLMFREKREMFTYDDAHEQVAYFYREMNGEN